MTTTLTERTVTIDDGRGTLHVQVGGDGPPLVFLHPADGLVWNPFLDALAEHYTIYAPQFPGTAPGDPQAIDRIGDVADAVRVYEEALRELGLSGIPLIGHSFGGMLAAELAAATPSTFSKVVLIDPVGLWRDDAPIVDWLAAAPEEMPGLLFADPTGPAATAALTLPADAATRDRILAQMGQNIAATGKLCWPNPDRGLRSRLPEITAPVLVVWGEQDALVSRVYAEDFRAAIPHCTVEIIPEAGHIPQVEQEKATYAVVSAFLG